MSRSNVKFFCPGCGNNSEVTIEPLSKGIYDSLDKDFWGDIVCNTCHLVICTIFANEPGQYAIVKQEEQL